MQHDPPIHINRGTPPRNKQAVIGVQYANGYRSRWTYRVEQLSWTITGDGWDIGSYWRAE